MNVLTFPRFSKQIFTDQTESDEYCDIYVSCPAKFTVEIVSMKNKQKNNTLLFQHDN